MNPARPEAGFTLLEVMVAIAILALSFAAIFSSEAGAVRVAYRARKMGVATLMARCKMGEIEEQVASEGLPAIDDTGSDGCCEDAEIDGFTCDWAILPVTLPETMFIPDDEEGAADGEDPGAAVAAPGATSATPNVSEMTPEEMMAGGGGLDNAAMSAISFVYPVLKPSFESQIRRATVTVKWREGSREHSFDVTQYLVANEGVELLEGVADPSAEGSSTPGGTRGVEESSP